MRTAVAAAGESGSGVQSRTGRSLVISCQNQNRLAATVETARMNTALRTPTMATAGTSTPRVLMYLETFEYVTVAATTTAPPASRIVASTVPTRRRRKSASAV